MLKATIIGNVARNNVKIETYNGRRVLQFSICHNEVHKDDVTGEWKTTSSQWITCFKDLYDKTDTPLIAALQKAKAVYVQGNLRAKLVNDKNHNPLVSLSIRAETIEIVSKAAEPQQAQTSGHEPQQNEKDDDLPF